MNVRDRLRLDRLDMYSFADLLVVRVQKVLRLHKSRALVLTDVIPDDWRKVRVEVWRKEDESLEIHIARSRVE